jgi:cell division protein FtsL
VRLQFEQAAKQESQRIQNLAEDGSDPDVKEVQVRGEGA